LKSIVTKVDDTAPPSGNLTATEYNSSQDELEKSVTASGQTLDTPTNTVRQLLQAMAVGGERVSRDTTEVAQIGEIVLPNNSAAPCQINLPSTNLFVNATVYFEQVVDQRYSVFALTIGRNGNTIMGLSENMVVDTTDFDDTKFKMVWNGSTWQVFLTEIAGTTL